MRWKLKIGLGVALALGAGTISALADDVPAVKTVTPAPVAEVVSPEKHLPSMDVGSSVIPVQFEASREGESGSTDIGVGQEAAPKWGPTPPEDVKLIMDNTALGGFLEERGTRLYGWLEPGYTYASTGHGVLAVEPRENRFGNEFLLSQFALRLEKPLKSDEFSLGYDVLFYQGADAALLQPLGGFTTTNPRYGADFRHLYVSAHLPILSEGGVDLKLGRQGTIIGYESAMAPYRPFYSNDYQWFYAQDGAWTGALANWHVNKQLDILSGITMGGNTFFSMRGNGPCYIGQINYWLQEEKKTLLSAGLHFGPEAIFASPFVAGVPTGPGEFVTVIELRVEQAWNDRFVQIIQSDNGWDQGVPTIGAGEFWSLYNIFVYHATQKLSVNNRVEWFNDVHGTRTGFNANYSEVTVGLDYHPVKALRIRPEIRGDFADHDVFGAGARAGSDNAQLTLAVDCLLSF